MSLLLIGGLIAIGAAFKAMREEKIAELRKRVNKLESQLNFQTKSLQSSANRFSNEINNSDFISCEPLEFENYVYIANIYNYRQTTLLQLDNTFSTNLLTEQEQNVLKYYMILQLATTPSKQELVSFSQHFALKPQGVKVVESFEQSVKVLDEISKQKKLIQKQIELVSSPNFLKRSKPSKLRLFLANRFGFGIK